MLIDTTAISISDFAPEQADVRSESPCRRRRADDHHLHPCDEIPAIAAISERYEEVFCTVGTHPNHALDEAETNPEELVALSRHPNAWPLARRGWTITTTTRQRIRRRGVPQSYRRRAHRRLPLVIHTRDADDDWRRDPARRNGEGGFHGPAPLLHRLAGAGRDRSGAGALYFLLRRCDLQEFAESARHGLHRASGAHAGRDRRAFPRADAASRQAQRTAYVADTARVLAQVRA